MPEQVFTPALGRASLTEVYDFAVRAFTREKIWRTALLSQLAPQAGEIILDVGCGTGSLAILLKRETPGARVIGIDPDAAVLRLAASKARAAGVDVEWRRGFATDAGEDGQRYDKVVSSLVFHQVPLAGKRGGIAAMIAAAKPNGEVHIADYARQDSRLMRRLFKIVQRVDGYDNTQPNADGALERILAELAPGSQRAERIVPTPTGAISLFRLNL